MSSTPRNDPKIDFQTGVNDVLAAISQDREREIISRRYGLVDEHETLEQVGIMLGVTRERVRQLEKSALNKLRLAISKGQIPAINNLEKVLIRHLTELGRVASLQNLTDHVIGETSSPQDQANVIFIAELAPGLCTISENDSYYQSVGILEYGDDKKIHSEIDNIVSVVKNYGQPLTIEQLHEKLSYDHPSYVQALASISKHLAHLKDQWGLAQWPSVNPRNIRDKIYVVLSGSGQPMHFSEIAKSIQADGLNQKDVTVQAIHNELIKDDRFILIGRGIYALDNWGFNRGTVSDIIAEVLKKSAKPMPRDEIVKQVLKSRHVKETTVILNLQKPRFKHATKTTYVLNSEVEQ
jgi:hypothetical protein